MLYLEKVRKKICFKEWRLIEQGLQKLEVEEAKIDLVPEEAEIVYTPVVVSFNNPAYLLPLANSFIFSSFLILPNPFSSNTPIPFSYYSLCFILVPSYPY